ncbi:guanylate cyclase [Plakobranchus ocellatus]|uniref:Guanylate cyclase n=1 Tax=Plakobranchus ocellatus TaxID=259542 RepID=A0AAV4AHW7_9GAST|nr:guanylate cyclase [Plakobranchus ocellatus]
MLSNDNRFELDVLFQTSLISDIVRALTYIHKRSIRYHGRLTSEVCLIDSRFSVKPISVIISPIDFLDLPHRSCHSTKFPLKFETVMMVFCGSAEILGFGSEEEFPRFPQFRWLSRLQLNKRAMIRGVLRNENSTTCGRDDNFIDLR